MLIRNILIKIIKKFELLSHLSYIALFKGQKDLQGIYLY